MKITNPSQVTDALSFLTAEEALDLIKAGPTRETIKFLTSMMRTPKEGVMPDSQEAAELASVSADDEYKATQMLSELTEEEEAELLEIFKAIDPEAEDYFKLLSPFRFEFGF